MLPEAKLSEKELSKSRDASKKCEKVATVIGHKEKPGAATTMSKAR